MTSDHRGYRHHSKSFRNAYLALLDNAGFLDLRKGISITPVPVVTYDYDHTQNLLSAHTHECTYSITPESITRGANTNIDGNTLGFKLHENNTHFVIHDSKDHICHYYNRRKTINAFFSEYGQYGPRYPEMRITILRQADS